MIRMAQLQELLQNRLDGFLPQAEITDLMAEIMKLEEQWEELHVSHSNAGHQTSSGAPDICWLADQVGRGTALKLYRRKTLAGAAQR